jgi:hypothetical protein
VEHIWGKLQHFWDKLDRFWDKLQHFGYIFGVNYKKQFGKLQKKNRKIAKKIGIIRGPGKYNGKNCHLPHFLKMDREPLWFANLV